MTGEGARAERHVLDAQEVRDFLQNHVVQGRRNEEGNYGARGRRARVSSSAARSSHARSPPPARAAVKLGGDKKTQAPHVNLTPIDSDDPLGSGGCKST